MQLRSNISRLQSGVFMIYQDVKIVFNQESAPILIQ